MKLPNLYRRRWWLMYLPIVLAALAAMFWASIAWKPLPPQRVVIGTGPAQSSYLRLAQVYAARLERMGLAVDIVTHPKPQDALDRLLQPGSGIDVTFAQGLYARPGQNVQALAAVGHEIVWVFARQSVQNLAQLRGMRIAAADVGSSNRLAADLLLAHLRLKPGDVQFERLVGDAAIAALAENRVDVVVHVATGESVTVGTLARMEGVHLVSVDRAGALAARETRLRPVVIPQGSIELRSDIPPADITTVATLTHLLVRPGLNPALERALLDVAHEIHVMAGFLEGQGQFPSTRTSDFPPSPVAQQYSAGVRPWLETLLPYRTAQWADLLLFAFVPMFVVAMVLLQRVPLLIEWRVNAVLQHYYGELKFLEADMVKIATGDPIALRWVVARLDTLEKQVAAMELPDRFADRWYTLREHLTAARERLLKLRGR